MIDPRAALVFALVTTLSATAGAAEAPAASPAPVLAQGDTVPAFEATGLDGVSHRVAFDKGSKTVLLFFLAGCPACHKMIPEWNRAYERRPKALSVLGVLLNQEPPGFFMATPLAFPVLRAPRGDFATSYKISHVPVTLRVGAGGRVEDVGVGQLDAMRLGEIFRP